MQIKYEKLPERYKIWKKLAIIFYNLAVSPLNAELISRIDWTPGRDDDDEDSLHFWSPKVNEFMI